MKTLLFIYNASSGKGKIASALEDILDVFTKAGYLATAYPTQSKGDATRAARELGPQFDRVVCAGGDGTLSETVAGLMTLNRPPVLGYVPAGSTNDCAATLRLPRDPVKAAELAAFSQNPRPWDIGRLNGRSFVYVAAFGAFTDVSYATPQTFKNAFGHLAYVLNGVSKLGSLKSYPLRVEHEGGVIEDEFIYGMVSNTVSVGGFKGLDPKMVVLDDGLFEVMLVKLPRTVAELNTIVNALLQQKPDGNVIGFHASQVRFTSPFPLPWTLDGEFGGDPCVAEVKNLPQAVILMQGK